MSTLYKNMLNTLIQKVHKDKKESIDDKCDIQLRIKDIEVLVDTNTKNRFKHYKESNPELYYNLLSCGGDKNLELQAHLIYYQPKGFKEC